MECETKQADCTERPGVRQVAALNTRPMRSIAGAVRPIIRVMTAVDPSLFAIAPSPQALFEESQLGAGVIGSAVQSGSGQPGQPQESPAELGDDALVQFTAAAQNWFNTEQVNGVPNSIISVQSMLSTLVGSMTANATEAFATAAQLSPSAALALTQF